MLGIGAYLFWGFLPLYFPLMRPAGAIEIVAHRVVWSLVFCAAVLAITGQWRALRAVVRSRRSMALLAIAAVVIALNWLTYVFAVLAEHVIEASLGYFINPLVTVLLAVFLLHERLRPLQWAALGAGALAVVVITLGYGRLPWISLVLAVTFGLYGLVKNRVGRRVGALSGLTIETAALAPLALGYLLWLAHDGSGTFASHGSGHALLLAGGGVVTALPLIMFAAAARRLPLSVIGLLQYLAPTLQFLVGLFVFHEAMPAARWWGFGLVWIALLVLVLDGLRSHATPRLTRPRRPRSVT
jgi:chloramphenicol-sensitive protein RarD